MLVFHVHPVTFIYGLIYICSQMYCWWSTYGKKTQKAATASEFFADLILPLMSPFFQRSDGDFTCPYFMRNWKVISTTANLCCSYALATNQHWKKMCTDMQIIMEVMPMGVDSWGRPGTQVHHPLKKKSQISWQIRFRHTFARHLLHGITPFVGFHQTAKSKSRWILSAVNWCPDEILTDNSETQRTVLWRHVKPAWQ